MIHWAFIYEHPDSDPVADRNRLDRAGQVTHLVPVPDGRTAARVAAELAADGVGLIEICGGFDAATVAAVVSAVEGRAAVGRVSYGIESLAAAQRYAEAASAT